MTTRQEALKKKEALLERFNAVLSDPAKALRIALRETASIDGVLIKKLSAVHKQQEPAKLSAMQRAKKALSKALTRAGVFIAADTTQRVTLTTYKVAEGRTSIEVTVIAINSPGYPLLTYSIADF